jgi:type IV secretory pathway VirB10-like protein
MSSSGLIYAVIVGAWAVYLVPMWLRREDELNRARQTQRYAAAIKVLSNKEAFERRWAQTGENTVELPIAVGQTVAAPASRQTTKPAPKKRVAAATSSKPAVTARVNTKDTTRGNVTQATKPSRAATAKPAPSPAASTPAPATAANAQRKHVGLMARRRRVVTLLFGLSTLGALVSADLGMAYLWAMALPAALLSVYIVRLRRDERAKATERVKRRAAAEARANREAEARARAQAEARAEAELEASERRQSQAAARRRTAAARSRAQALTTQPQDSAPFPRASNG